MLIETVKGQKPHTFDQHAVIHRRTYLSTYIVLPDTSLLKMERAELSLARGSFYAPALRLSSNYRRPTTHIVMA